MALDIEVINGDCLQVLDDLRARGVLVDSCVTDTPYHLTSIVKRFGGNTAAACKTDGKASDSMAGAYARASKGFMGKTWDGGDIAFRVETWRKVFGVLKPGGHLLAFSGSRTFHRMACAIEDAGFEIRDSILDLVDSSEALQLFIGSLTEEQAGAFVRLLEQSPGLMAWMYGSGFPKSKDCGEGWGTALKPAFEPIVVARKPVQESSVAANFKRFGVGGLNIDATRISYADDADRAAAAAAAAAQRSGQDSPGRVRWGETDAKNSGFQNPVASLQRFLEKQNLGRWPANIVHDGSAEVVAAFPATQTGGAPTSGDRVGEVYGDFAQRSLTNHGSSVGSAARFFYSSKADGEDRFGSKHPTVKPVDLICWLIRLVTPKGGLVLDPFAGSGTCGAAALREGMRAILIEREPEYYADILTRIAHAKGEGGHSTSTKARHKPVKTDDLPLFGGASAPPNETKSEAAE